MTARISAARPKSKIRPLKAQFQPRWKNCGAVLSNTKLGSAMFVPSFYNIAVIAAAFIALTVMFCYHH